MRLFVRRDEGKYVKLPGESILGEGLIEKVLQGSSSLPSKNVTKGLEVNLNEGGAAAQPSPHTRGRFIKL